MNQLIIFLATGIAGFIFHSLIKLKSLKDDWVAASDKTTKPFNVWNDYVAWHTTNTTKALV